MKQGAVINRIVMSLFFTAIVAYMAGAAWRGLREPYPTARAYAYAVEDTLETAGWLVRREEIISGSGGIVRLLPAEGEKVAAGTAVALLYADRQSLEESDRLARLESEIPQLSSAIAAAGEPGQGDSTQRTADALVSLRSAVERGDFTRLEEQTAAFRSAVYQQAGQSGETGDLTAVLASKRAEAETLRSRIARSAGYVTVSKSGVFSGQADGYETVLTPDALENLTPSVLESLEGQAVAVGPNQLGKLITDATWYFVCSLPEDQTVRLTEGERVTVRFSRDWSGEVEMTVQRIGAPENSRVAIVLASNRYLSDVTLLRRQTVDLVFGNRTGIRVPASAVRVEEITEPDPETGDPRTTGRVTCVYVRIGVKAERKPVNVIAQGQDYYIVTPVLPAGSDKSAEKKALRPGEDVIVGGQAVWDGKVLQ